jgi:uncharacterized protein YdhG (YjbR/CyaY superfamily)
MSTAKPTTIPAYIKAAPAAAQPHLRRIHALLKEAAPQATEAIKWGSPFFVEPRFLFGFSAHKAHLSFAPPAATLAHFAKQLAAFQTTKMTLKLPYDQPLPEALIRKMAAHRVKIVGARQDDSFW